MVALDEQGRPAEVTPIEPQTEEEQRRHAEAELRRRNRLAEREEIVLASRERTARRHALYGG